MSLTTYMRVCHEYEYELMEMPEDSTQMQDINNPWVLGIWQAQ